jgi:octaprenyl-diphosphate synthase
MNTMLDMTTDLGRWLDGELELVSKTISLHLHNDHDGVNELCGELAAYHGKMLRPSLLLLSWKSMSGEGCLQPDSVVKIAAVVELIHLATLVHDDVLDEASIRRGEATIHCLRGNEAAVMLGDYLLSSAFHLCSTVQNPSLNILLGDVSSTVCAGEMMQLYHRNNVDLNIDDYYQIIKDKTAALIAASCTMGGMLAGAPEKALAALTTFGNSVGVAFQIRDDLIDILGEPNITGKESGVDLEKGKLTLPIISMLQKNPNLRPRVLEVVASGDLSVLRELLESTGSIRFALHEIGRLVDLAVNSLRDECCADAATELCDLVQQLKNTP